MLDEVWEDIAVVPSLAADVCQVWWADLGDLRRSHLDLLDRIERERLAALLHAKDRDRFTLGVALSRLVLGAVLQKRPEQIRLDRSCPKCGDPHWRPRIAEGAFRPVISVSHSGKRVVLAIRGSGDIGVDVEQVDRSVNLDYLSPHVLADDEAVEFFRLAPEQRHNAFLSYWTRKEAALKAVSEGLRTSPRLVSVTPPDQLPRVRGWKGRSDLVDRITLLEVDPGPGYLAQLAVLDGTVNTIRQLRACRILTQ